MVQFGPLRQFLLGKAGSSAIKTYRIAKNFPMYQLIHNSKETRIALYIHPV